VFERRTIDILAERVHSELLIGHVSAKLVYRFFRKGRRDGQKALGFDAVQALVRDAVGLAGHQIAEDYLRARRTIEIRRAELNQVVTALGYLEHPDLEPADDDKAQKTVPPVPQNREEALAGWRGTKERRVAEQRLAAKRAVQAQVWGAKLEVARLEADLVEQRDEAMRRCELARHGAAMLWDRYCNGFEQGIKRRGSRPPMRFQPTPELHVVLPLSLTYSSSSGAALTRNHSETE
jgi:hypothetical protein